jgi:hypothetical protein
MWNVFASNRIEEISPSGMIEGGIGNRDMVWSHLAPADERAGNGKL